MLTQILNKWPDLLEVYRDVEDGPPRLLFVCVRKNSRTFQADQLSLLRVLEEAGQKVVVRVGNVDLSLDQFEMGGAYGAQPKRIMAQSTFYNKQAELRRYEAVLEKLPLEDPAREAVAQRVLLLKAMLGVAEDNLGDKEAIAASDERLKRLEQLIAEQDSDESVLKMDWRKIQPDSELWKRKLELHRKRGDIPYVERKPVDAGEGTNQTNQG